MTILDDLANKYACDKGTKIPNDGKHHGPRLHFTTVYHKYFDNLRKNNLNILEIGIGSGPSLKLWHDYFEKAQIHAIDINNCKLYENERTHTYIADQSNKNELINIANKIGKFDIIIDDGGHMMRQQQISLATLFKYINSGGLYFIEDLHTSFWEPGRILYDNTIDINEKRSNTTFKMLKDFIDTGVLSSEFMNAEEIDYLNNNIDYVKLFDLPDTDYGPNKLGLLVAK